MPSCGTGGDVSSGTRRWRCLSLLLVSVSAILHAGCRLSGSAASSEVDDARLTVLTKHYAAYLNSHQNQPPANEAEFKRVLTEGGHSLLERADVSTVDELFVSPRDGQPFVVEYGTAAARLLRRGVVAHERTGTAGVRLVGYRLGFVEAADAEKFRTLVPDAR